jgi:A/G-specific adenine glycosylase
MTNVTAENPERIVQLRFCLLQWYYRHQRDLPWRNNPDPYRVWVSEVMLQQTQVATVIPYYERFVKKFTSVERLAAAPLDDVLKAWEGLGYYARARNMHKAAIEIVSKHGGRFPQSHPALQTLPGFGEYTAGAVASIAFGAVVPAVDGNVKRVIARLFALQSDITRAPAARRVKELARALVDEQQPGDWNQAVMELGATICLPKSPKCAACPVSEFCQARRQGIEQTLPVKPAKKALPHFDVTAAVIHQNNKLLIAQRPPDGMLGGLWEFPGGKQQAGETLPECLQREILEELGLEINVGKPIAVVKHGYTHFKITLHAFFCTVRAGTPQAIEVADWRWVTPDELAQFAFPRTDQQIIAALKNNKWERVK